MSQSIAIPTRRGKQAVKHSQPESSASSSSSTSFSSPSTSSGKAPVRAATLQPTGSSALTAESPYLVDPRPSLLSRSIAMAEHAVINVGTPEAPRLITCVKSSQGFDWNLDMFLPSYVNSDFTDLEHRQDPVADIILTEEERENMLPS